MKLIVLFALTCFASFSASSETSRSVRAAGVVDAKLGMYVETRAPAQTDATNPVEYAAKVILVAYENEGSSTQELSCKNIEYPNAKAGRQMGPGVFVLSCKTEGFFLFLRFSTPDIKSRRWRGRQVDWSQTCGASSILFTTPIAIAAQFQSHEFCLEDWSGVKNPKDRLEREMRKIVNPSPARLRLEEDRQRYEKAKEDERKRVSAAEWKRQLDAYAKTLQSDIFNGNFARFEQHLNAGADINLAIESPGSQDRRAPLLVALDKPESAPYALALISRGANLSPQGLYEGVNVLMLAAGNSTPEVMQALLARQAFDVNQRNPKGATALSYAVASGRIDNVRLLLALGADSHVMTGEGSLIDIANLQGHTEIVALLTQHQKNHVNP